MKIPWFDSVFNRERKLSIAFLDWLLGCFVFVTRDTGRRCTTVEEVAEEMKRLKGK